MILYTMLDEITQFYFRLIEKIFRYGDKNVIIVFAIKNYLGLIDRI